jgi:hypothetical protein
MKHFFYPILLGMVAGCSERPPVASMEGQPDAPANLDSHGWKDMGREAKNDPGSESGGKGETVESGVLHDRFEFVSWRSSLRRTASS